MSDTLREIITQPAVRPLVVDQCVELVEQEVKGKGLIIRGAFKTVKKIKPGFVKGAIDGLLDDWLDNIESYYSAWSTDKSGSFSAHLTAQKRDVANDLLKVTDERAASSRHKTAAKMYGKLRPSALNNVETAVPGLASLIEKHF